MTLHNGVHRLSVVIASMVLFLNLAVSALAFELPDWTIANQRDHALVGTVWEGNGIQTTAEALGAAILQADHVAVGEIHTNADHHLIQAAVIDALVAGGRRPAIVFEMVPESLDGALQEFLAAKTGDATELGELLKWEARGWPDWSIYRPIAETALRHGLAMRAGDMDKSLIQALGRKGSAALEPSRIEQYGLDRPLDPKTESALTKILFDGHCGLMPKATLAPMLTVQRARDGALAAAMISAASLQDGSDGAVLIAGAGHVRKDWGAPEIIKHRKPDANIVAIALVEVDEDHDKLQDYALDEAGAIPYDFVIFTPRAEREDPCIGLKERFKTKAPAKK